MASDLPIADKKIKKEKSEKKEKKRKRTKEQEDASKSAAEATAKKHKKPKIVDGEDLAVRTEKGHKASRGASNGMQSQDELLRSRSPFVRKTVSFYVTLSPCAQQFPLEGVCAEHLSPLLLTYYPPLKGVLLSYSNPRLSEKPEAGSHADRDVVYSKSVDEYAVTFVWITAEFLVFSPGKGSYLEGYVNLQNESLLGLMCYNYFNAAIEQDQIPSNWTWTASKDTTGNSMDQDAGHFVDEHGVKVEGKLIFQVRDFDAIPGGDANSGGMIHIYGTLLSSQELQASSSINAA